MADLFEKYGGSSVFRREDVLYPDYVPDRIVCREAQLREIVYSIRPVLRGGMADNLFIHGPPGTGKTVTVKYVFRELEKVTRRVIPVYINCWLSGTKHSILHEISKALGLPLPRRGIATDELLGRIEEVLRKKRVGLLVALDESDRLVYGKSWEVLYDLARLNEEGYRVSIILISNKETFLERDPRIRSSLPQKIVEFPRYTVPELKEILWDRVALAFKPGALEEDAVALAAAYGYKEGGDARIAIQTLLTAGRIADMFGKNKVTVDDVREAYKQTRIEEYRKVLGGLEGGEREVLLLIAKKVRNKKNVYTGELFREMCGKEPVSERTFRYWIQKLIEKGIIETKRARKRGNVRQVILKIPPEIVLSILEGRT